MISIKNTEGDIVTTAEEINKVWTDYFQELLNIEVQEEEVEPQEEEGNIEGEGPITMTELEEAIKKMKSGKTAGCDGIVIELIKEGGELLKRKILKILNVIWTKGEIPEEWGKMLIIPIFKGKGDKSNCQNYRGISLINHITKLYERILEKRARSIIEEKLGKEQYGFRKNRGTTDLIFALRIVIEKSWEFNKAAYIAFIDLQKAFDSVPREKVWKCLERRYNIKGKLKKAIMSLYKPCLSSVRTGYENDTWFSIDSGVKQGSVISPLLFIAYMDEVTARFNEGFTQRGEGDVMIYADDIAVWSENKQGVVEALERWDTVLTEAGLKMNVTKTEIMKVSRNQEEEEVIVEIRGNRIKNVSEVKYLGSVFSSHGNNKEEINDRIVQCTKATGALYPLPKDQHVPLKAKKVIFESIITPTLMYGSETWTMNKKERSKIQASEMRVLRTIVGKTRKDRIRNEKIREEVGVVPVLRKIDAAQLRWLGHLERMEDDRVAKRRWNWTPQGTRPRGRPRKRWKDTVKETLERYNMPKLEDLTRQQTLQNRPEWKKRLARLTEI